MARTRSIFATLLFLTVACGVAGGQSQTQKRTTPVVEVQIAGAGTIQIPDLDVRDQDGRKLRFYSDLIKDKVVVLSFFYTSCTYTCTMQGQTFSKLQSLLGERLGKSVFLISVTTDPTRDDSAQLKSWGKRYNVQAGWTLVTGKEPELNKLLLEFTGNRAGGDMHLPSIFIGNDRTGLWTSAVGVFDAEEVGKVIDHISREDAPRPK
jgi:protein SCO1/2